MSCIIIDIITKPIQYAYLIGDKDEATFKHVGFTLSAIYQGKDYKNPYDYKSPFGCEEDPRKMKMLHRYWKQVENVCEAIGAEAFREIIEENELSDFFSSALERERGVA